MAERRNNRNNSGANVSTFRERGTFARASPMAMTSGAKPKEVDKVEEPKDDEVPQSLADKLSAYVFAGLPHHYPLRKKVKIAKQNFLIGISWDLVQLMLAFLACAVYVVSQYPLSLRMTNGLFSTDVIITQFFMLDFFLNWYIHGTVYDFFTEWITMVDILTIIPVYFSLIDTRSSVLSVFRCLRILRLIRVFQGIKWVREMSGVQRQIMSLLITIISIVFLATSVVQYVENDIHQFAYNCQYINRQTEFEPSCSPVMTVAAFLAESPKNTCDCSANACTPRYNPGDTFHEPTAIRCTALTFFDSFYFIIVTMSSVGYGEISPTTSLSQLVVVAFIFSSLILIPMQITELQNLIASKSPYRAPYVPRVAHEPHVILCGHVQNKRKLERFFHEFFHPDRAVKAAEELHAVILAPNEPSEEIRNLLFSHGYDARVTYVIGTALNVHDLKSVLADQAVGIFFLCNTEANEFAAHSEDASIVLRALSVSNFNPNLRCLVQVIRPEDSTILRDSEIGAISCLDEFKTSCIARNALCPGFACIIENLFHTMGALTDSIEESLTPWYREYMHGAGMESYFVPLPKIFLMAMNYNYKRVIEAIFVQFDTVVLGLTNGNGQTSLIFNPLEEELHEYANFKAFFADFNVAVIIGDDQKQADDICKGLGETTVIRELLGKLRDAEKEFSCFKELKKVAEPPPPPVVAVVAPKPQIGGLRNLVNRVGIMRNVANRLGGSAGAGNSAALGASRAPPVKPVDSPIEVGSGSEVVSSDGESYANLRGAARFKGLATRVAHMKSASNLLQKLAKSPVGSPRTSDDGSETESAKSFNSDCSSVDTNDLSDDGFHYHTRDLDEGPKRVVYSDNEEDYVGYRASDLDIQKMRAHGSKRKKAAIAKSSNVSNPQAAPGIDALALAPNAALVLGGRGGARRARRHKVKDATDGDGSAGEKEEKKKKKKKPTPVNLNGRKLGRKSREIEEVSEKIMNHVIVTGCDANLIMFLSELRKPAVNGGSYHPIVVVSATKPSKWDIIRAKYNDIYLVLGTVTKMETFKRINVSNAFSFVLLASRDDVTVVDNESVDAKTLFAYLRLEQFIPKNVMFSVELTTTSNMTVLNATIMRREREAAEEEAKKELALNRMRRQIAGGSESGMDSDEDDFSIGASGTGSAGRLGASGTGSAGRLGASSTDSAGRLGASSTGSAGRLGAAAAAEAPAPMLGGGHRSGPPPTAPPAGGRGRRMSAFESAGKFTNSHAKPGAGSAIMNPSGGMGLGNVAKALQDMSADDSRGQEGHNRSQELLGSSGFNASDDNDFGGINKRTTGRVSALTVAANALKKKLEESARKKETVIPSVPPPPPTSLAPAHSPFKAPDSPSRLFGLAKSISKTFELGPAVATAPATVPNVRDLKPVDPSESTPVREDSGKRDRDHSDSQCSVGSMEGPVTRMDRVGSFMKSSISNMFRKGSLSMEEAPAESAAASYFKLPTMRHDSIIKKEIMESTVAAFNTYEQLFDATETHHVLPVFAAGQAFVPSCFETLLVQSFYIVLTPIICEKLVSGQLSQTVVQVAIPPALLARKYVDVFRLFMSQRVLCLGLYRAPQKRFGALLPYVYLTPPGNTEMYADDKLFCFGNADNIDRALKRLNLMFAHNPKLFTKTKASGRQKSMTGKHRTASGGSLGALSDRSRLNSES